MSKYQPVPLKNLNLTSRFLFDAVMEDSATHRDVLEIALGREIPPLTRTESEKEFRRSPEARAIRMDIFAEDEGDILGFESRGSFCGQLKKVDISRCPALSYFKNWHAENLDVSANPHLKELYCEHGTFDTLDLSGNPELEKLTISFCENLKALNLSKNLALKELELTCAGVRRLGLHNRSVLHDVVLDNVELDGRSMKYLHQVLEQNGGSIRKSW